MNPEQPSAPDERTPDTNTSEASAVAARRPYSRPDLLTGVAFERQALSCASQLMTSGPLVDGCGMRS
jgi:hypothetical protein